MGHCVSVKNKKNQNNKNKINIISNNMLQSNQTNINTNQIIIPDIPIHLNINIPQSTTTQKFQITINSNEKFEKIYDILNLNNESDYDIQLINNQIISYVSDISVYELLSRYYPNGLNNYIDINLFYKGLDIPKNILQSYIEKNSLIGSAIFDNSDIFIIITYEKNTQIIKPYIYDLQNNDTLSKFNYFTAYCNANGILYFSGGESEQSEDFDKSVIKYNDFLSIDLNNIDNGGKNLKFEQLPNLIEARSWHSMIFVPNKYIFIVGGSTKSVEIYDIEKNNIFKDSEMNETRNECTLCMVNENYLYCFCGFLLHQTFNDTVERCNLRKRRRVWNYVNYNVVGDVIFKPSFFAVSYFGQNEILLIGGNDNNDEKNKNYLYKIGNNDERDEISEFNANDEKFGVFRDKLFTPIDNNFAINIPLIYGNNIQFLKINMENGFIEQRVIKMVIED